MADLVYVFNGEYEHQIMITARIYPVTNIIISLPNKKEKYVYHIRGLDYTITVTNKIVKIEKLGFNITHRDISYFNLGNVGFVQVKDILKSDLDTIHIYERKIESIEKRRDVIKINDLNTYQKYKATQYKIVEKIEQGIRGTLNVCNMPNDSGLFYSYFTDIDTGDEYTIVADYTKLITKLEKGEWVVHKQLDSQTVINGIETTAIQYVDNANLITGFDPETKEIKYQYFKQVMPMVNATIIYYTREDGCLAISGNILYTYYAQLLAVNLWDILHAPAGSVKIGFLKGHIDLSKEGYTYWDYLSEIFTEIKEHYDLIAIPTYTSKYVSKNIISYREVKDYHKYVVNYVDIPSMYCEIDEPMSTQITQTVDVFCVIPLVRTNEKDFELDEVSRVWIDTYVRPDGLAKSSIFEHLNTDRFNITKIDEIHKDEDNSINVNLDDDEQHIFWLKEPTKIHTNKFPLGYRINRTPKLVNLGKIDFILQEVPIHTNKVVLEYRVTPTLFPTNKVPIDYRIIQTLIQSSIISYEYLELRTKMIADIITPTVIQIVEEHGLTPITFNREKGEPILTCDDFYQFFKIAAKSYYEYFHFNLGVQNKPTDISVFAVYYNETYCDDIRNIYQRGLEPISITKGSYYNLINLSPKYTYWWYDENTEDWKYNIANNYVSTKPHRDVFNIDNDTLEVSLAKQYDDMDIYKTFYYKDVVDQELNNKLNLEYVDLLKTNGIVIPDIPRTTSFIDNLPVNDRGQYYVYDFQTTFDLVYKTDSNVNIQPGKVHLLDVDVFLTDIIDSNNYEDFSKITIDLDIGYLIQKKNYQINEYRFIKTVGRYVQTLPGYIRWYTMIMQIGSNTPNHINWYDPSGIINYDMTCTSCKHIVYIGVVDPDKIGNSLFKYDSDGGFVYYDSTWLSYSYGVPFYYDAIYTLEYNFSCVVNNNTDITNSIGLLSKTINRSYVPSSSGVYYDSDDSLDSVKNITSDFDSSSYGRWETRSPSVGIGEKDFYNCDTVLHNGQWVYDCYEVTKDSNQIPPLSKTITVDYPVPCSTSLETFYNNLPKTLGELADEEDIQDLFNELKDNPYCNISIAGYDNLDDFKTAFSDKKVKSSDYGYIYNDIVTFLSEIKDKFNKLHQEWKLYNRGLVTFVKVVDPIDILKQLNLDKYNPNYDLNYNINAYSLGTDYVTSLSGTIHEIIFQLNQNEGKIADAVINYHKNNFDNLDYVYYHINFYVVPNDLFILRNMVTTKEKRIKELPPDEYKLLPMNNVTISDYINASEDFGDKVKNYEDIDLIATSIQKTKDLFFENFEIDFDNPYIVIKHKEIEVPVTNLAYISNARVNIGTIVKGFYDSDGNYVEVNRETTFDDIISGAICDELSSEYDTTVTCDKLDIEPLSINPYSNQLTNPTLYDPVLRRFANVHITTPQLLAYYNDLKSQGVYDEFIGVTARDMLNNRTDMMYDQSLVSFYDIFKVIDPLNNDQITDLNKSTIVYQGSTINNILRLNYSDFRVNIIYKTNNNELSVYTVNRNIEVKIKNAALNYNFDVETYCRINKIQFSNVYCYHYILTTLSYTSMIFMYSVLISYDKSYFIKGYRYKTPESLSNIYVIPSCDILLEAHEYNDKIRFKPYKSDYDISKLSKYVGEIKFPIYKFMTNTIYDLKTEQNINLPDKYNGYFGKVLEVIQDIANYTIYDGFLKEYDSVHSIRADYNRFLEESITGYGVRVYVFYSYKPTDVSKTFRYSVLKTPCLKTAKNTVSDEYNLSSYYEKIVDDDGFDAYKLKNSIPNEFYIYDYYDPNKWKFGNIHTIRATMFRDLPLKFPLCRLLVEYSIAFYIGISEFIHELNKFTTFIHDAHKFKVQFTKDKSDDIELIQFLKQAYHNIDLFAYYDFSADFVSYLQTKFQTSDPYKILLYVIRLLNFYDENCDKIICGYIEQMGKDILIEYQDNYNTTLCNSTTHMMTNKMLSGKVININELNRIYKAQNYDVLFHKPQSLFAAYPIYGQMYLYSPGLNTIVLSKYEYFDIEHSDWYILVKRLFISGEKTTFEIKKTYPCGIWNLGWYKLPKPINGVVIPMMNIETKEKYLYEVYTELKQVRLRFLPWGYKIIELPIPVWIFKLPLKNVNLIREIHARTVPARAVRHTRFSIPEYTKFETAGQQFTYIENKLTRGILIRYGDLNFDPNGKLYKKDKEKLVRLSEEGWDFYLSTNYEYPLFNEIQDLLGPRVSLYPFFERFDITDAKKVSWDICREQLRQLYRYAEFAVFEIDLTGNAYPVGLDGLKKSLKDFDSYLKNIFMDSIRIGILTPFDVDKDYVHDIMSSTTVYSEIILQVQYEKDYNYVIENWSSDPLYKMKKVSLSFKIYYGDNVQYLKWMNKAQFEYDYTRILVDDFSLVISDSDPDYDPGNW